MGCATSFTNRVSAGEYIKQHPSSSRKSSTKTRVNHFRPEQDPKHKKQNGGIHNGIRKHPSNQTLLTLPEESSIEDFRNGPGQKFFKEFPTTALLQEAQRAYLDCNYEIPKGDGMKRQPYPVQSWKTDVFRLKDFEHIDKHAMQMPASAFMDTLEELVADLLVPTKDTLGAVRVIFRWIASQDVNQMNLSGWETPSTAAYYFYRIKQQKGGYAELFQKMCLLANVTCVLIHGFVKGVGYEPGDDVTQHAGVWSAVLLNNTWRLVDCQWGSSHVTIGGNGLQSGTPRDEEQNDPKKSRGIMSYAYEEFYFLPDPHHLICSHFPYEDKWQLLARPLTLEEFEKMAYLKPKFFDLGFDVDSHPECTLLSESGECSISIRVPPGGRRRFVYRLYLVDKNNMITETREFKLQDFVFLEILRDLSIVRVRIHFPFTGKYKFKLFSKDTSDESNEFASVCSYVIYCDQAVKLSAFELYPNNPRQEWGTGADTDALGTELVSHKSARIETEGGETEVRFRLHKEVEFLHKFLRRGDPEAKYRNFVFQRRIGNEVIFKVRLPHLGKYMLSLYAKEVKTEGKLPNVCNFLIECDEPAEDTAPFPAVYNGRVGPNENFHRLKMSVMGEDSGYLNCNESGELVVQFKTPESLCLLPKLCLQVGDGYKEMDQYAKCITASGQTSVHMLFPEPGLYQFILYGKHSSSSTGGHPPVYYGVIQADFPKVGALPFPKVFSNWKDNFRLLEPKSGFLPTNSRIRFLVDIPDCDGVAVIGSTWNYLQKNQSGLWEGDFDTGDSECDLKLSASLTKGSDRYSCLQLFKVVSEKTLEQLTEKQKIMYKESQIKLKARLAKRHALTVKKGRSTSGSVEHQEGVEEDEKWLPVNREAEDKKSKDEDLMLKVAEELQRQKTSEYLLQGKDTTQGEHIVSDQVNGVRTGGAQASSSQTNGHHLTVPTIGGNITGGAAVAGAVVGAASIGGALVAGAQAAAGQTDGVQNGVAQAGSSQTHGSEMTASQVNGAQVGEVQHSGVPSGNNLTGNAEKSRGTSILAGGKIIISHVDDQDGVQKDEAGIKKLEDDAKDAEMQAALLEFSMSEAKERAEKAELERQKEIAEAMRTKAAHDKLEAAVQKQDRALLEQAIKEFKTRKIKQTNHELDDAQNMLDKLALKESLMHAMEAKDLASLKRVLGFIEEKGFSESLSDELTKGKEKLKILERISKLKSSILSMDANTMTEMRRYNNPPEMVHKVMAATLLALGEHEGITKKWKNCQKRCNPTGPEGLKRRVFEFDVDKFHPEIAARVGEMLSDVELDDVKLISSGAATFFVWTKSMVEEIAQREANQGRKAAPASKFRQKQLILGRGDIDDDDGDRPISRASIARPTTARSTTSHGVRPGTTRSVRRPSVTVK